MVDGDSCEAGEQGLPHEIVGKIFQHDAMDFDSWVSYGNLKRFPDARLCCCHFLVGQKRDLGPRACIMFLTPIDETPDLTIVARELKLRKGLSHGPLDFLMNSFSCERDFLTPLCAIGTDVNCRIAVSTSLSMVLPERETDMILLRSSSTSSLVCSLKSLLEVLVNKGVRVHEKIGCTAEHAVCVLETQAALPESPLPSSLEGYAGTVVFITAACDCQVDDFRDLKEGVNKQVIAEGPEGIRMLLGSDYVVEKILMKPSLFASMRASLESRAAKTGQFPTVLLCEAAVMEQISGIPATHASAAIAAAGRKVEAETLAQAIPNLISQDAPLRVLLLHGLDEESVGSLFRVAAAFGINLVLLSSTCGDPFHRRAVRVSMGHVFRVPAMRGDLQEMLAELKLLAVTTIFGSQEHEHNLFLDDLGAVSQRWACVVGPDDCSSVEDIEKACDRSVAIRTLGGIGPLNVGVFASILLHGCMERETSLA